MVMYSGHDRSFKPYNQIVSSYHKLKAIQAAELGYTPMSNQIQNQCSSLYCLFSNSRTRLLFIYLFTRLIMYVKQDGQQLFVHG